MISCKIDPISADKLYKDDMKTIYFVDFQLTVQIFLR